MPSNTTRIAKNTLMLYFRQILIMLVNLYAVRVVLNTLGAVDYGIYNVVGGMVVMFSFFNIAMTSATQRFLNFAMGQNDTEQAKNVYSISFIIHILIAVLVIILSETAGLCFFYTWLNIPDDRQNAAFIVYQFSIAVTVINIIRVPYQATVIAYEKMSFFALISIIESVLKMVIVFFLTMIFIDKLISYSFLVFMAGIIVFFVYKIFCNRMFEIARFRIYHNKELFWRLTGFSGWSIFSQFSNLCRKQGINVLVNIFHGVTVNAAIGIAMQVNSAVYLFVSNFQTAFRPQIIKSYAAKNYDYFIQLIFQTSKSSFFLLFLFVLPLYVNAEFILNIWIKNVPEYTVTFTRLILLFSLVDAISGPLWMSIHATGNIKKYQLIESCFTITNIPLAFLILLIGSSPIWIFVIEVSINVLLLIWRIFFVSKRINILVIDFLFKVIMPILIIAGISSIVTIFTYYFFIDWNRLLISCVVSTLCISSLVFCIGLDKNEKMFLKNYIRKKIVLINGQKK